MEKSGKLFTERDEVCPFACPLLKKFCSILVPTMVMLVQHHGFV
jgi:hypothetical protein